MWLEKILSRWRPRSRRLAYVAMGLALLIGIAAMAATVLPIAPIHSPWWNYAVTINGDLAEEIGWPELSRQSRPCATRCRKLSDKTLPSSQVITARRARSIFTGRTFICHPQSAARTPFGGAVTGIRLAETVIVVGFDREFVDYYFRSSELVAHVSNREGITNEETTRHPDIFLCRRLKVPWAGILEKLPALRLNNGDRAVLQMLTGGSFDHAQRRTRQASGLRCPTHSISG